MSKAVPNETPNDTFGETYRWLRRRAGVTLREVSQGTGVSLSHLGLIETGVRRPPDDATCEALMAFLGYGFSGDVLTMARRDRMTAAGREHDRAVREAVSAIVREAEQQNVTGPAWAGHKAALERLGVLRQAKGEHGNDDRERAGIPIESGVHGDRAEDPRRPA